MNSLTHNEQGPIGKLARQAVVLDVGWSQAGTTASAYAFLLDAAAVLPSPAQVIVASGSGAHGGAVRLYNDNRGDLARAQLQVHLAGIDTSIHRLRVVLAAQRNVTLEHTTAVAVSAWDPATGVEDLRYQVGAGGMNKCLVLGDLRRGADGWMFEAQGQEFAGSVKDLANRLAAG